MAQQQKINTVVMVLVVITMATHYGGVMSQFSGCATMITSIPECADFITNLTSTASSDCCNKFESVIKSQPQCLCQVFNSTTSSMGLAKACNVDKPSECNASPSDSPPSGTTPSPGTNATSPPAGSPPSDATSTRYTTFPVLCLLLVAAYAMVF